MNFGGFLGRRHARVITLPAFRPLARSCSALAIALALAATPGSAAAQMGASTQTRDSFQIGSAEGALCRVQADLSDPLLSGMFERSWTIVCRDAAQPVGRIFALRGDDALSRAVARSGAPACDAASDSSERSTSPCATYVPGVAGERVVQRVGDTLWVADGIAVYRDAMRLGLDSLIAGHVVTGTISVATTSVTDSAALARLQTASLPIDRALAEGYRRNNSGDFAEAAVYFEALEQRGVGDNSGIDPTEFILNRALQLSNLGDFANADRLFAEVDTKPTADIVQLRLRRNFRAMHYLNQRDLSGAIGVLDLAIAPVGVSVTRPDGSIAISRSVAAALNSGDAARSLGQLAGEDRLTPEERAVIIDAQAMQLRGTAERLSGELDAARASLERSFATTFSVRNGRVTSILRLQSQILGEIALVEEAAGNLGEADSRLRDAVRLLEREYPETLALAAARAKLAAFLTRRGRPDDALVTYRQVVGSLVESRRQLSGVYNQMAPYYQLLVDRQSSDATAAAEFFAAAQLLVRPGVADTQAQLARELSAGDNDAASLFRQANTLTRDIERARIDLGRLTARGGDAGDVAGELQARIDNLSALQTATLGRLSDFPQYRAVAQDSISLADLQSALRPGEAYVKLAIVGETLFGFLATRDTARAWRTPLTRGELDAAVDQIRNSVSILEGGQYITYPFDAEASATLYTQLFGPVADIIQSSRHLIFEPDGAMLRLPVGLLITDTASVAAYRARTEAAGGDPFDMRGVAWLGRHTRSSTAVSPIAFRNTRMAPPSRAANAYAGFGSNLPAGDAIAVSRVRGGGVDADCSWSLDQWNRPISPAELFDAQSSFAAAGTEVITGGNFTDRALMGRTDLANYRILHFATHGLVTPPRPECVVKPALLTSFDTGDSDGLLSFDEIFALRLDADLVILSACDTAGQASIAATRAAGVTTGGGSALDGLVRAFIGAGGRSVLASHWPAPDDFNATTRLIGGIFRAGEGVSVADALGRAQDALMDDANTSHPYYWAGFAIVGDGDQPIRRAGAPNVAAVPEAGADTADTAPAGNRRQGR